MLGLGRLNSNTGSRKTHKTGQKIFGANWNVVRGNNKNFTGKMKSKIACQIMAAGYKNKIIPSQKIFGGYFKFFGAYF